MAQDPDEDEEQQEGDAGDTSHSLDMVTIYTSSTVDAEMEADVIHGVLESNGVPSYVVRGPQMPSFGYEVQVPRARLEEARRLIAEAEAAGPDAAAEGEAASEQD